MSRLTKAGFAERTSTADHLKLAVAEVARLWKTARNQTLASSATHKMNGAAY
jgi:hypothetical protein